MVAVIKRAEVIETFLIHAFHKTVVYFAAQSTQPGVPTIAKYPIKTIILP
jgi:hypothetical protein